MKVRTWVPLAAASLVLVSGCAGTGGPTPGTASVVGDQRISVAEVDDVTAAQCRLTEQGVASGQSQVSGLAVQKQQILRVLIELSLNEQFAASRDAEAPAEVRRFVVAQGSQGLDQLDTEVADALRPVVERLATSQADLAQVAAADAGQELTPENLEQLVQVGVALREDWQGGVDIETDARYAPDADGIPGSGDGSVSRASSDFAEQAQRAASGEDPAFAAGLPPAQRCGG